MIFLLYLLSSLFMFTVGEADTCFFSYNLDSTTQSQVFGPHLLDVETPCLIWFKTEKTGFFRLDVNNKIFASKREKKSCLSEYVVIQSSNTYAKLCHSNVTKPVEIKDFTGEVTVLIKWVGVLDPSTSYLGRFSFEEDLKAGGTAGDDVSAKLSETIAAKLKKYMTQKDQKHRLQDIDKYQFKTSVECGRDQGVMCKHSRFCADLNAGTTCNSSLYLCLPSSVACDGVFDCLDGDLSDETGCYLPYVLFSTGGVVLTLTLLGSAACFIQHHKVMSRNDMVRFNNDLVRRKDKVKARKADLYSNKPKRGKEKSVKKEDSFSNNGKRQGEKNSQLSIPTTSSSHTSKEGGAGKQSSTSGGATAFKTPGPVTHTSSLPPSGARKPIEPAVIACKPGAALQTAEEFEMKPPAPTLASIGDQDLQRNVKIPECAQSAILTPAPKESAVRKTGFCQETPCISSERVQENGSADSAERINKNGSKLDLTQLDERTKSIPRKERKILADEKEILREIRQRESVNVGAAEKPLYLGPNDKYEMNGTEPIVTQSQLERLEQVGITPIRRPIIRDDSRDSLINSQGLEDTSRTGYGYRFDFRGSHEFEFTEDAYI
ncbi:uncharacterized protein LOC111699905 isoform X2 [Eurytemora carolleeae]|uniref:uncharacterized protein LOC111699905 isoform X2 n=1 Tax=Eurytemora carolleeae TaxID=1294199 RepID=UPI000C76EEB9|nr:uncharacterized protein LOC111699905 isoform X2 [Eurytemora carolleeae]|eukprot:XP_023326438.1 uncharacterized protein LOC111699905 isoform X2 [Eurytemora affinis]